jgi:hypothetical protein
VRAWVAVRLALMIAAGYPFNARFLSQSLPD